MASASTRTPAPDTGAPPPSSRARTHLDSGDATLTRPALPYAIAALVASAAMAWYFFVFVPAKLDYFIGMRFRTLAVAARHVSNKIDNLATGLGSIPVCEGATGETGETTRKKERYVALVLPEIRLVNAPGPPGPALQGCGLEGTVAWTDVVREAAAASRRDFDDLILATNSGDVVWQRETGTPRIANLSELLGATDDSGGWGFSWLGRGTRPVPARKENLQGTAQRKVLDIGGSVNHLLAQAVPVNGADTLYIAGLVAQDRIAREARRIPTAWLVPIGCGVVLLFLAIPFLKLATLTATERFRFSDVLLMMFATVATVGFGALVPTAGTSADATDETLDALAASIQQNLKAETRQILDFGRFIIDSGSAIGSLKPCAALPSGIVVPGSTAAAQTPPAATTTPTGECALWDALATAPPAVQALKAATIDPHAPPFELDVVIWLDRAGQQVRKWTTKHQITGPTSHATFAHYHALARCDLWTLQDEPSRKRFTVEPLLAPTTSQVGVVFAMPIGDCEAARGADRTPSYLALNVRPQALIDAIAPPGLGFAVVAQDGRVLFHSDEALSLEENFFEELGDAGRARDAAGTTRVLHWSGEYHGRQHRFGMQPVTAFEGCPWTLVTFRESEPALADEVTRQAGTFRLGLVNVVLMAALALAGTVVCRLRRWRLRDVFMLMITDTRDAGTRVAWLAGILVVEALAAASAATGSPVPLDVAYGLLVAAPLAAVTVLVFVRPKAHGPGASEPGALMPMLTPILSLALLVITLGALPAIGFHRIVGVAQHVNETGRWLDAVSRQWTARSARVEARLHDGNYTAGTKAALEKGFGSRIYEPGAAYSYLHVVATTPTASVPRSEGQRFVRWLLAWNVFSSRDEPSAGAAAARAADVTGPRGMVTLGDVSDGITSPVVAVLGLLVVAASLAAAWWARAKLLTYRTSSPSLDETIRGVGGARGVVVLVIGPPTTRKDAKVREAVTRATSRAPIERIRLLHAELTPAERDALIARVNEAAKTALRTLPPGPLWIHVSNLEAQLVDPRTRGQVLELLSRLLDAPEGQTRVLVVTSSIDPVAHFEEVFQEERKRIYADAVPEVALSRSALLLSRVRRCYVPIGPRDGRAERCRQAWEAWWNYAPANWLGTLEAEVAGIEALWVVRDELAGLWRGRPEVPFEELVQTIRLRAAAYYHLLWTTCTRSEKLVLIQIAQESFVIEDSWNVVASLMARGLVVERSVPTIVNRTFRDFLLDIERDQVVQEWERGEGHGLWLVASRLIGSSLAAGAIFFLLTQDVSVQALLPIVSGTGVLGLPLVRTLVARFSNKGGDAPA